MSADNNETPDKKTSGEGLDQIASIKSELDSRLAEVTEQLKAMNQMQQEMVARATAQTQRKQVEEEDLDPFDTKNFKTRIVDEATAMTREMLREEQRKSTMIYQLSQEYPEITSDSAIQKAILAEQKSLPRSLQDTAEGYETAVLKAMAKQGVLPKSKRPTETVEADVSMGSGRGVGRAERGSKSNKVSEKTLLIAKLLGRDINDKEVLKGLEEAANRDTYARYR